MLAELKAPNIRNFCKDIMELNKNILLIFSKIVALGAAVSFFFQAPKSKT